MYITTADHKPTVNVSLGGREASSASSMTRPRSNHVSSLSRPAAKAGLASGLVLFVVLAAALVIYLTIRLRQQTRTRKLKAEAEAAFTLQDGMVMVPFAAVAPHHAMHMNSLEDGRCVGRRSEDDGDDEKRGFASQTTIGGKSDGMTEETEEEDHHELDLGSGQARSFLGDEEARSVVRPSTGGTSAGASYFTCAD